MMDPNLGSISAEHLLSSAPIGLALFDRDFRYKAINPVLASITGKTPREHLDKAAFKMNRDQSNILLEKLNEALRHDCPVTDWEIDLNPADDPNSVHTYLGSSFPIRGESQETIGVGISLVDITRQKEIERTKALLDAELKTHANFSAAVFEQMPAGIYIVEVPSGRIIYRNQKADEILGHFKPSLKISDYQDYGALHSDGTKYRAEDYPTAKAISTAEPIIGEEMIYRKDNGEIAFLSVNASSISNSAGQITHAISVFYDITEQRRLINRLEEERDLRARFSNAFTHDLRSPLTTAKMAAEYVLQFPEKRESHEKILDRAIKALERCERMVIDLLDVSRLTSGHKVQLVFNHCHLNQIIKSVIDDLMIVKPSRVAFDAKEEIFGFWNAEGIRRILENLLTNALKYGDTDQVITVTASRRNNWIEMKVHNFGTEISKVDQLRLFDLFLRMESAKNSGQKGWGIGLTLVKGLVEAHGGSISVSSNAQVGTTFRVILPEHSESPVS